MWQGGAVGEEYQQKKFGLTLGQLFSRIYIGN